MYQDLSVHVSVKVSVKVNVKDSVSVMLRDSFRVRLELLYLVLESCLEIENVRVKVVVNVILLYFNFGVMLRDSVRVKVAVRVRVHG